MLIYSEAVVVVGDWILDILEVCETLKDSVLKHSMELMLNAGNQSVLLKDVKSESGEICPPVKRVQVEQLEFVNDLAHSCLHFSLVKESFVGQQSVLSGQLLRHWVKPWVGSFESKIHQSFSQFWIGLTCEDRKGLRMTGEFAVSVRVALDCDYWTTSYSFIIDWNYNLQFNYN